jgi:hypothetical protein
MTYAYQDAMPMPKTQGRPYCPRRKDGYVDPFILLIALVIFALMVGLAEPYGVDTRDSRDW